VDDSVALAIEAGVKRLVLFHHDPDHDDKKIDAFVKYARHLATKAKSKLKIDAAREGMEIQLGGKK
jgi:phosphoribosyl 1,2-cyclic phosphodiesterase